MSEEERNRYDDQETDGLVKRYEEMATSGKRLFFDLDEFEAIIEYYAEKGGFDQGAEVISYAAELFPNSTILMLREAQMLAGKGETQAAIPKLRHLLSFEPHNEEIYLTLASIYSQNHEHLLAVQYYREALRCADSDLAGEIYIDIALEYENLNDFHNAIIVLKEALEKDAENETAIHELAYCFEMLGEVDECIHYYQEFIDRFPYSYTSWYNLGNSLMRAERAGEAVDAFGYCLAIEENFGPACFNRAMAYIHLEKYPEAISDLMETQRLEAPHPATWCYIGECHEKLENLDEARQCYRKAIELDDEFSEGYVGLGVICDLRGEFRESLAFFRKALELEQDNEEFHFMLAEALRKCNLNQEAREVYDRLVGIDQQNEEAWLEYADLVAEMEGIEYALHLVDRGLGQIPAAAGLLFRKVAYLHQLGKRQQAYVLLHELLPEHGDLSNELTDYYPDIKQDPAYVDLCGLYNK